MTPAPAFLLAVLLASESPCDEPARRPDTSLDWLADTRVRAGLVRLIERAAYGLAPYESAAWVVRDREGSVDLRPWALTGAVERATWRGPRPEGAIAIVHTHPRRDDPRPSSADASLARRLGLTVYTLSAGGVWAARSDGRIVLEVAAPRACAGLVCLP